MKILCYTSFTFSYLNRARVLFQTLRKHHPDWELAALITDRAPEGFAFDPASEQKMQHFLMLNGRSEETPLRPGELVKIVVAAD